MGLAFACSNAPATTQELPAPCSAPRGDFGLPGLFSPAQGSVIGSEVVARLCTDGASARLERIDPIVSPMMDVRLVIAQATVDPARDFQIALPADSSRFTLLGSISMSGAHAGTYTEAAGCGDIVVCTLFPPPASVHCPETPGSDVCGAGCSLGSTCAPTEPAICYEAFTDRSCGDTQRSGSRGTWRLTLSSVEPYGSPDAGDQSTNLFVVHGSLDATLAKVLDGSWAIGKDPGAPSTVDVSLTF
jgi:hypothetical protein